MSSPSSHPRGEAASALESCFCSPWHSLAWRWRPREEIRDLIRMPRGKSRTRRSQSRSKVASRLPERSIATPAGTRATVITATRTSRFQWERASSRSSCGTPSASSCGGASHRSSVGSKASTTSFCGAASACTLSIHRGRVGPIMGASPRIMYLTGTSS
jgi:hypothetical protein